MMLASPSSRAGRSGGAGLRAAAGADSVRIVGGRLRGRPIAGPKSQAIRPTSDQVREALFNVLLHRYSDPVTQARVLDLFAGTGALGLEALSREADFSLFVDNAAEARALLRANTEALGLGGRIRILRRDATRLGRRSPALRAFSLVFLDPPYGCGLAERALVSARSGDWIAPGALIVVEEAAEAEFGVPVGFDPLERRRYDETELILMRNKP